MHNQPNTAGRAFAVLGTMFQAVALVAIVATGIDMWIRFREASGVVEPEVGELPGDLAGIIVLWSLVGLAGLLVNLFTVMHSQYRARWFFWVSLVFASGYLLVLPIGTLVSLVFIVYLIIKRAEFFAPERNQTRHR